MSLALHRSAYFNEDFDLVRELARHPGLGRERKFRHEALKGLRSFRVTRPFHRHLIFYRATGTDLFAERVMHGTRDLPRRLREPPSSE